jgi:SAM domain (Sterile alpha motif)
VAVNRIDGLRSVTLVAVLRGHHRMGDGVDIAAWLRELGVERYEQRFRESGIDTDILADLTETDLEELGISLSHRKKLLKAIAALSSQECSGAVEPTAIHLEAQQPGGLAKFQAERRQLTVLFCGLVGSTVAGLDPEDMGAVIHAWNCDRPRCDW